MAGDGDGLALLARIAQRMAHGSAWRAQLNRAATDPMVGIHLAICVEPFLGALLDGRKTIESRFSIHRTPPFRRVNRGDIIMLKRAGGPVMGVAIAGATAYYELDAGTLNSLRKRFARELFAVDDEFWEKRSHKRFASLICIESVAAVSNLALSKRDRRGWVIYRAGCQAWNEAA